MDTDQNEMPPRTAGRGGFPGGRTPLPRIARPSSSSDQDVLFVDSAFRRDQNEGTSLPRRQSGFENYFPSESLFEAVPSLLDEAIQILVRRSAPPQHRHAEHTSPVVRSSFTWRPYFALRPGA